jgi:hypothetical protein
MNRPVSRVLITFTLVLVSLAHVGSAGAITFESTSVDGSRNSAPAVTGTTSTSNAAAGGGVLLYALEAPQAQKERLASSIRNLQLSGMQADLAMRNLRALDGKEVPDNEILARLVYAEESLAAVERAAKGLEDSVALVKIACMKNPALMEEIVAFLKGYMVATPAVAFNGMDGYNDFVEAQIANEIKGIGRAAKSEFDAFMNTLSKAAGIVGDAASKVKGAVVYGISKVTGAVGAVHIKIGNVVGQKNWAAIMAGTKFVATTAGATAGLIVAAPATAAGAVGAVAIWTAANIGAGVSLANDVSVIQGGRGADDLDAALTRINQGTALIGLVGGGSTGEIFVNVVGVTGNEIIGTTPFQEMTDEELTEFLEDPAVKDALRNSGLGTEYRPPSSRPSGGGENSGGGSSGGGCNDGCGN